MSVGDGGRPLLGAAFRTRLRPLAIAACFAALVGLAGSGRADEPEVLPGQQKSMYCAGCHGADGNSELTDYPILAGQTARYLYLQLKDYKSGLRKSDMMTPVVQALGKEDMLDLAAYYAAQRSKGPRIAKGEGSVPFQPDPERVAIGKKKAAEVLCTMCHLGEFAGQNEVPRVSGQHPEYVVQQLKDYRSRTRTNDAGTMTAVARTLSDEDIENLAQYLASL
jgi:cytochrome c553